MKPTEELYYKYAGVISSVVDKYAYQCPDLADDLLLQAQLLFCQACVTYDPDHPSKASFETWLRNKLRDVTSLIKKQCRGPSLIKKAPSEKTVRAIKQKNPWSAELCECTVIDEYTSSAVIPEHYINDITPYKSYPIKSKVNLVKASQSFGNFENLELSDITCKYVLEDYSKKIADGEDKDGENHDYPKAMLPYIRALRGDSLQVFKDFCEGRLEREPRKNLSFAKQKARGILSPSYIYNKFYKEKGWSRSRVENAWRGLRGMLKNYVDGKLPTTINNPTLRKNKVHRGESSFEKASRLFEERHSLSFNTYRVLCKKGILHKENVAENEDLSKYLLHTFAY